MLVTVVALFAGYHDVGDGRCVVCRLSRCCLRSSHCWQVITMLVTVVALFAGYQDVGDGRCVVCRLSRCW